MGSDIEISKEKECFYVLDRDLLDKRMAENAESCGCEIRYGERVTGFSSGKDRITVKTGKGSYESRMVAGCDGARSAAASHMGSRPLEMVNGLIEIIDVPDHSGRVEMWFDPERNNDGFFWRIPRGENTEYGVMGKKADFRMLEGFFETNRKRVSKRWASPIPLGTAKTYGERMILVGDAACQTKPWSGGGLTYGILAADAAAPVIRKAVDKNDFSPRTLSAYEDAWSKIFGKDIKMGLVAREVYKNMAELGEEKIRQLVSSLKEKQQEIDFDFPFSHVMGDSFEI